MRQKIFIEPIGRPVLHKTASVRKYLISEKRFWRITGFKR